MMNHSSTAQLGTIQASNDMKNTENFEDNKVGNCMGLLKAIISVRKDTTDTTWTMLTCHETPHTALIRCLALDFINNLRDY